MKDYSGLRLYYTPKLRKYDGGVLRVGHDVVPSHMIPPGRPWTITGHCTSGCTESVSIFYVRS